MSISKKQLIEVHYTVLAEGTKKELKVIMDDLNKSVVAAIKSNELQIVRVDGIHSGVRVVS